MTKSGATFGPKPMRMTTRRTGLTSGSVQRRSIMTGRLKGFRSALFRIRRTSISAMTASMTVAIAYQTNSLIWPMTTIMSMIPRRASGGPALSPRAALAEERGADAHERRALLDCHLEVVRHAHRKLALRFGESARRAKLVAQPAQASEVRAHKLRVFVERRKRHEPLEAQARASLQGLDY